MPRPLTERQSLEQERAELRERIADWEVQVGRTEPAAAQRREFLGWQIRNARRRLAMIRGRLAALDKAAAQ